MKKKDVVRIGAIMFSIAVVGVSVLGNRSGGTVIKAKAETLEYAQESVGSLSLLNNSEGVSADKDVVDLAIVGTTSVTYSNKKKSKTIDYQVVDSQVPVVQIDKASLAYKTGEKVEPKVVVTDPVDGTLEKLDKLPSSKVEDSSSIGKCLYYDNGWYVVNTSKVDASKDGEYDAKVTAADKHGNTVIIDFIITVGDGTKVNEKTTKKVNGEKVDSKDDVIVDSVSNTASASKPSSSNATSGNTASASTSSSEPAVSNGGVTNNGSPSNSNSSGNNSGSSGGSTSSSDDGYVFTPPTPDSNGIIFYDKVTDEDRKHCNHEWVEFNMPVSVAPVYDYIDHPQEGHYETYEVVPGYYESYTKDADGNVVPIEDTWVEPTMGERYVIDKEAWTEKVLVKEGYTYTKFLGYSCKWCGARKDG